MKMRIYAILVVLCLLEIILSIAFVQELKADKTETFIKEPEPLIIKKPDWSPHGVFSGTIVIDGDGITGNSYEGLMYIEMDGNKIRISCTEAVRSRYGEWF